MSNNQLEHGSQPHLPSLLPGDICAIIKKHGELHALLEYICLDDFHPFSRLSTGSQQNILRLARSASLEIGETLNIN